MCGSSAFGAYSRSSLKFESDLQYEVLSGRVGAWNFGHGDNGYLNVSTDLQDAMRKNPHLKVLVAPAA